MTSPTLITVYQLGTDRRTGQQQHPYQCSMRRPPENTNWEGNQADTTRENENLMRVAVVHCPHLAHIQRKDGGNTTSGNRKMGDETNTERSIRPFWTNGGSSRPSHMRPVTDNPSSWLCFVPTHACHQTFSDFSTTQVNPLSCRAPLCPCPVGTRCSLRRVP